MERKVALEHVHSILLEGEDGRIVQYAEQGDKPEAHAGEDLPEVADLERIFLLFCLAGLCVEFPVHEEVDDEHHQGDADQYDTEGYGT